MEVGDARIMLPLVSTTRIACFQRSALVSPARHTHPLFAPPDSVPLCLPPRCPTPPHPTPRQILSNEVTIACSCRAADHAAAAAGAAASKQQTGLSHAPSLASAVAAVRIATAAVRIAVADGQMAARQQEFAARLQQDKKKPKGGAARRSPVDDSDEDELLINSNPRNAHAGDYVSIYWAKPVADQGWWTAKVLSVDDDGKSRVQYMSQPNEEYVHSLIISTHASNKRAQAGSMPWKFVLSPVSKTTASKVLSGCECFPFHRLLVVVACFWDDFRNLRKRVEFRPEDSVKALAPGMCLLLAPPLAERREKLIDLLHAEIVDVAFLSLDDARTQFPVESLACDLPKLHSTWKCTKIGCVIVKGLRPAPEFACLAPGNKGFLHQFSQDKGTPQFCSRLDVGKTATLQIVRHGSVQTVQRLLINRDSHLTDGGDCLSNPCSDCKDDSSPQNKVTLFLHTLKNMLN